MALQWGHASSRVETKVGWLDGEQMHALQWGHASSRVETTQSFDFYDPVNDASMGPRVFTRGNEEKDRDSEGTEGSFNGATRLHAWKQTTSGTRTLRLLRASMGPRVFTRGNASQAPRGLRKQTRFNGATRLHAWKR